MPARIDYAAVSPESTKGLTELARYVRSGTLPLQIVELVKLRVSQINECAYCLDLHYRRARRAGVPQAQLDTLAAWTESPAFSGRERAALTWAESLTHISAGHVPDSVWEQVRTHFSDREIVDLSIVVVDINAWNRLMVGFRTPPTFGSSATSGSPASSTPTTGSDEARTGPTSPAS